MLDLVGNYLRYIRGCDHQMLLQPYWGLEERRLLFISVLCVNTVIGVIDFWSSIL